MYIYYVSVDALRPVKYYFCEERGGVISYQLVLKDTVGSEAAALNPDVFQGRLYKSRGRNQPAEGE